jgi:hypothetical protein
MKRGEIDPELKAPVSLRPFNQGRPPDPNRRAPTEMRVCRRHGETEFAFYGATGRHAKWRCKRCVGEAVVRRLQKMKRILVEEGGGGCAVCGYDAYIGNLHFHHVDPSTKSFPLSMGKGKSLAAYREEAKKCVLVCANCHGEIEGGLIDSPSARAKFPRAAA